MLSRAPSVSGVFILKLILTRGATGIEIVENPLISRHKMKVAERGGFEPPIQFYSYNGLANRRFRPLSHLSSTDFLADGLERDSVARAGKLIVSNAQGVKRHCGFSLETRSD